MSLILLLMTLGAISSLLPIPTILTPSATKSAATGLALDSLNSVFGEVGVDGDGSEVDWVTMKRLRKRRRRSWSQGVREWERGIRAGLWRLEGPA
jgi:hypothetical protein